MTGLVEEVEQHAADARRAALGSFLRARRAALQPSDVGLVGAGRRLVAGLRRHEVADLAGISVSWYTWLEQGRDIQPSAKVIDALADALQLEAIDRRYLRELVGLPLSDGATTTPSATADMLALLEDLLPLPAAIANAALDLIVWNCAFAEAFTDPGALPDAERNWVWAVFMSDQLRERREDWPTVAAMVVARFRAAYARNADDPRFNELVARLSEASVDFRALWATQSVAGYDARPDTLHHPVVGAIAFRFQLLHPLDDPGMTLALMVSRDKASRARLEQLADLAVSSGAPVVSSAA